MRGSILLIAVGVLIITQGCKKRLDSFLFNNTEITEYLLDDYQGKSELDLPIEYSVPLSDITRFEYEIDYEGEKLKIYAVYVGDISAIATDTVILYCHGNKDHMDNYWPRQKLLSHVGGYGRFGVLMFDYPGYGLSEGKPTEENMYLSADGALKWLKNKGLTNERLVVYGYSLGSAPTSKIAGSTTFAMQPNKIVLEAPFASSAVMVQDASLINMPSSYFVNTKIDNAELIKECKVPLYWLHGIEDDFLSMETHGRIVYENHANSWEIKREIPGANHSDVPTFMGLEEYKNVLLEFLLQDN